MNLPGKKYITKSNAFLLPLSKVSRDPHIGVLRFAASVHPAKSQTELPEE